MCIVASASGGRRARRSRTTVSCPARSAESEIHRRWRYRTYRRSLFITGLSSHACRPSGCQQLSGGRQLISASSWVLRACVCRDVEQLGDLTAIADAGAVPAQPPKVVRILASEIGDAPADVAAEVEHAFLPAFPSGASRLVLRLCPFLLGWWRRCVQAVIHGAAVGTTELGIRVVQLRHAPI